MLTLLLSAALAAAPAPRVASVGLHSEGTRGAATATLALERVLQRAGVVVVHVQALPADVRAAVQACAAEPGRCTEAGPGSARDTPQALLLGTLRAGGDGGVVLEAELRSATDGRVLEHVRVDAGGVPDVVLLLEDPALSARLASALGHRWSVPVQRNPDWFYAGAVGLGAATAGTILFLKGHVQGSSIGERGLDTHANIFKLRRDAERQTSIGAVVAGAGALTIGATAALWWALPVEPPGAGRRAGVGSVLLMSGSF